MLGRSVKAGSKTTAKIKEDTLITNRAIIEKTSEGRQLRSAYKYHNNFFAFYCHGTSDISDYLYNSLLDLWEWLLGDCISFKDFQLRIEKLLFELETKPTLMFKDYLSENVRKGFLDRDIKVIRNYLLNLIKKASIVSSKHLSMYSTNL